MPSPTGARPSPSMGLSGGDGIDLDDSPKDSDGTDPGWLGNSQPEPGAGIASMAMAKKSQRPSKEEGCRKVPRLASNCDSATAAILLSYRKTGK